MEGGRAGRRRGRLLELQRTEAGPRHEHAFIGAGPKKTHDKELVHSRCAEKSNRITRNQKAHRGKGNEDAQGTRLGKTVTTQAARMARALALECRRWDRPNQTK
jgi:hypothetical protein